MAGMGTGKQRAHRWAAVYSPQERGGGGEDAPSHCEKGPAGRTDAETGNLGICPLRDDIYDGAGPSLQYRRGVGMLSGAMANRIGFQAPEDAGGVWCTAQARRSKCAGVALWQALDCPAGAKTGTAWTRYFPLGLSAARSVEMAARGESLTLPCTRSNRRSSPRFRCKRSLGSLFNCRPTSENGHGVGSHGLTLLHP